MIADELRSTGRQPYIIPLAPGHPPLGALGYVRAAEEILDQLGDLEDEIDHIFVASGSGSTHAGLLFGLRSLNWLKPVIGVCVRRNRTLQHDRISNRCREVAELLDMDNPVTSEDIRITDETFAPGYGKLNDQTLEAIDLCARREGLLLDPVYTGKSMAACLKHVRNTEKSQSTLFIHTGGTPGLFGYSAELNLARLEGSHQAGERLLQKISQLEILPQETAANTCPTVDPNSEGRSTTVTPHARRMSTFSLADSPAAETIAPAWPMVRPWAQ